MNKKNGFASRDDFLKHRFPMITAEVPELGGKKVGIRMLSGRDRIRLAGMYRSSPTGDLSAEDSADMAARVLAMSLCDSKGDRLFTDDELDVVADRLGDSLFKLGRMALEHNGFVGDDSKKN